MERWDREPDGQKNSASRDEPHRNSQFFLTRAHFEKDNTFRRFRDVNLAENQRYQEFAGGIQTRSFALSELPPLPDDSWFWSQLTAHSQNHLYFHLDGLADTARFATLRVSLHGRSNTAHDCDLWLNDKIRVGGSPMERRDRVSVSESTTSLNLSLRTGGMSCES